MIIEMRSYDVRPGTVPEVEKRFGEALHVRTKFSPLGAFWHTEVGPLNRVIHVWQYETLEERMRIRAEAAKTGQWPPKIGEFCVSLQSEIYIPTPFSPPIEPRQLGGAIRDPQLHARTRRHSRDRSSAGAPRSGNA